MKIMSEQHTTSSPEADVFREYKKIKTLVREKRSEESNEDYIKDVWPMINNATECDEAKKLWLSHVTAHPLDKEGTAEIHYRRLVLEDMDDEDSQIKRAKVRMDRGQRLTPVWHVLKQTISPSRYVKALREITQGRRGEIAFAKMPMQGTTVPQMDQAVVSCDLEQQFYEERRKKETGQGAKPPTKASMKAPANPPNRPPLQRREEPQRRRKEGPLRVPQIRDRRACQVMTTRPRVTLENAYWRGDEIYTEVGKEPYLVDTGAEVSMTRRGLKTTGYLTVQFANGTVEEMPYGIWQGIIWVKGPCNLITVTHLKELNKPFGEQRSLAQRLSQLQSRLVKVGPTQSGTGAQEWYNAVDVPEVTEQKLKESDFSPAGKEKLRKIITSANVARFKNDCGDLGPKYVHLIEGASASTCSTIRPEPGCC
ncbi:hypothetical protein XENOCAPTIV_016102 [Xenoophorus captivus]|uniref:Uncharacterized protein n=1 Tax=Xenoophorus captivus TaxID=1517983 RepID=A0ABV0QAA2_9TELE